MLARTVKMTAMPQLVSLFNAVGGGAAALVAIDDFIRLNTNAPLDTTIFVVLGALIGSVTFSGVAHRGRQAAGPDPRQADLRAGRPAGHDRAGRGRGPWHGRPHSGAAGVLALGSSATLALLAVVVLAGLIFGITMVLPIGTADMPVVMALLNSYAGLVCAAMGFAIGNNVLIIAGTLNGFSGFYSLWPCAGP